MGYKFNVETGKWDVWFGKRHPGNGKTIVLRRNNLESESVARKVEKQLLLAVSDKLHRQIVPSWAQLIDAYIDSCRMRGLTEKPFAIQSMV